MFMSTNGAYASIDKKNSVTKRIEKSGSVIDEYKGSRGDIIYYIEDLHCNKSVQYNTQKIIEQLKMEHDENLRVIGV